VKFSSNGVLRHVKFEAKVAKVTVAAMVLQLNQTRQFRSHEFRRSQKIWKLYHRIQNERKQRLCAVPGCVHQTREVYPFATIVILQDNRTIARLAYIPSLRGLAVG